MKKAAPKDGLEFDCADGHIQGMKITIIAVGIILSGCQSKPIEQMTYTEAKQLGGELHQRCVAQGVKSGSSEFDACMRQELSREASIRQEAAARRANNSTVVCNNVFGTVICN